MVHLQLRADRKPGRLSRADRKLEGLSRGDRRLETTQENHPAGKAVLNNNREDYC